MGKKILLLALLVLSLAATLYTFHYPHSNTVDTNVYCSLCGTETDITNRGLPMSYYELTSTQPHGLGTPLPGEQSFSTIKKNVNYFIFIADWLIWFSLFFIIIRILPIYKVITKKQHKT